VGSEDRSPGLESRYCQWFGDDWRGIWRGRMLTADVVGVAFLIFACHCVNWEVSGGQLGCVSVCGGREESS
jgi:hypothetical protein